MKSVAYALSWEFFKHHLGLALVLLACANALPVLVIIAMSGLKIDLNSPDLSILPVALIPYTAFLVGMAGAVCQGPLSRLFLKPLSNLQIISSAYFPGLLLTGAMTAGSIWSWNQTFGLRWPVLGPAIYAITFWAVIYPSLRVSVQSPLRILESMVTVPLMFLWFFGVNPRTKFQNSALYGHFDVTDIVLIALIVTGGFWLSLRRVAADRCGRSESRLGLAIRELTLKWDAAKDVGQKRFSGAFRALLWYEWKTFGMPYVLGISVALILIASLMLAPKIFSDGLASAAVWNEFRNAVVCIYLIQIAIAGLWGLLAPLVRLSYASNASSEEFSEQARGRDVVLGDFRSTLPLSDKQMAAASMATMALVTTATLAMFGLVWSAFWIVPQWFGVESYLDAREVQLMPWFISLGWMSSWAAMVFSWMGCLKFWRLQIVIAVVTLGLTAVIAVAPTFPMVTSIGILTLVAALAVWELIRLIRRKDWRKAAMLLGLTCAGLAFVVACQPNLQIHRSANFFAFAIVIFAVLPNAVLDRVVGNARRS